MIGQDREAYAAEALRAVIAQVGPAAAGMADLVDRIEKLDTLIDPVARRRALVAIARDCREAARPYGVDLRRILYGAANLLDQGGYLTE